MKSDDFRLVLTWTALALLVMAAFWWSGNRNAIDLYYPNARQHQKEHYPLATWTIFVTSDTVTDVLTYYEQSLTEKDWEYITLDSPSEGVPNKVICFNRHSTEKLGIDSRTDACANDFDGDLSHYYYYGEQIQIEGTGAELTRVRIRD